MLGKGRWSSVSPPTNRPAPAEVGPVADRPLPLPLLFRTTPADGVEPEREYEGCKEVQRFAAEVVNAVAEVRRRLSTLVTGKMAREIRRVVNNRGNVAITSTEISPAAACRGSKRRTASLMPSSKPGSGNLFSSP